MQRTHHFGRDAMDAKSHELIAVGSADTRGPQIMDKIRSHVEDPESHQLVRIQSLQMLVFHVLRKLQAHVLDRHAELFFPSEAGKTHRLHLLRIFRIGDEMKQPGPFSLIEVTLAFKLSGISRDCKMYLLLAGL